MDWELYAWLKRGNRRKEILKLLVNTHSPITSNEIGIKLKVSLPQVSFTIKELFGKELIECLNPKDKIGRLYKNTSEGKVILNEIYRNAQNNTRA